MAMYNDKSMDNYLYSSYNPYSYRYLNPKHKGGGWRQKSYLSGYEDAETYFDNHQRAQLKSILSQINPNLTPRLRKANTKDVGIQVNPKTDASVQCSLGPRTLLARKREALRRRRQEIQAPGSPVSNIAKTVRFPRTLALYSPIASRRLTSFLEEEPDETKSPAEPPGTSEDAGEAGRAQAAVEDRADTAAEEKPSPEADESSREAPPDEAEVPPKDAPEAPKSKARVRFQFLEQKYGYYHCRDCNLRWESAYVWFISSNSVERARNPITRTAWRTSPARPANSPGAPVPRPCATSTPRGRTGRTCAGGARASASPATALSALNTLFRLLS
ncbi:zygote arrest protein 1 isoform X2 [Amia ocellicauda]|uniref:zygote arrest protein 1 isoform X2 n=1 Tax=Amia ocellicauda TaxID=2972642 RepID=UPI0034642239